MKNIFAKIKAIFGISIIVGIVVFTEITNFDDFSEEVGGLIFITIPILIIIGSILIGKNFNKLFFNY